MMPTPAHASPQTDRCTFAIVKLAADISLPQARKPLSSGQSSMSRQQFIT